MTLAGDYFDEVYRGSADPWGFQDRWYEKRKRALSLALLAEERYARAFEPGCSIGVLTRELAPRCDHLLATDLSPVAVAAARERCADLPHVQVELASLADGWPSGSFDLVVMSEVLYYFALDEARQVARAAMTSAQSVLAVHWRHDVPDYPLSGDEAHRLLADEAERQGLTCLALHTEEDLVAALWCRDARSVAARTGLR